MVDKFINIRLLEGNQTYHVNADESAHPSDPFGDSRLLRDDELLRLSRVADVGSAAELHGRGRPLFSARVLRLKVKQQQISA